MKLKSITLKNSDSDIITLTIHPKGLTIKTLYYCDKEDQIEYYTKIDKSDIQKLIDFLQTDK